MIADYGGEVGDPAALAARLDADPGIAAHGLFPPAMVSEVLVGGGEARGQPDTEPKPRRMR